MNHLLSYLLKTLREKQQYHEVFFYQTARQEKISAAKFKTVDTLSEV